MDIRLPLRRAFILAKRGLREEALAETKRILQSFDEGLVRDGRYPAASVYAELYRTEKDEKRKEELGRIAVELIKKSIEQNRADSATRNTTWQNDPELDVLRNRSDYKELAEPDTEEKKSSPSQKEKKKG